MRPGAFVIRHPAALGVNVKRTYPARYALAYGPFLFLNKGIDMTTETVSTVAGTSIWISAAAPASQTVAGFAALTWTRIGEVTNMGSVSGREYNTSTHAPIDRAQQIEKKASYKLGTTEITVGWDEDDAGQMLVAAASKDYSVPSFKVIKQNGAIRYFTAQVSKFVEENGAIDDTVTGAITLLRQTDTLHAPGA